MITSNASRNSFRYPWPASWDSTTKVARKGTRASVVIVVIGALLLPFGIARRQFFITIVAAFIVIAFGALGAFIHVMSVGCKGRGSGSSRQLHTEFSSLLFVPQVRRYFAAFNIAMLCLAVAFAAAPFLARMYPNDGTYADARFHAWAPFMPLLIPFALLPLLAPVVRKRNALGIGICAEGIYYWARYGCFFFSWEWIKGVRALPRGPMFELVVAEPGERPENPEENWYSRIDQFRMNNTKIQAGMFAVNPALVYYAVCYYFRHPDRRAELGTQAAVDRMRRADYPDIVREIERNGDVRWR